MEIENDYNRKFEKISLLKIATFISIYSSSVYENMEWTFLNGLFVLVMHAVGAMGTWEEREKGRNRGEKRTEEMNIVETWLKKLEQNKTEWLNTCADTAHMRRTVFYIYFDFDYEYYHYYWYYYIGMRCRAALENVCFVSCVSQRYAMQCNAYYYYEWIYNYRIVA